MTLECFWARDGLQVRVPGTQRHPAVGGESAEQAGASSRLDSNAGSGPRRRDWLLFRGFSLPGGLLPLRFAIPTQGEGAARSYFRSVLKENEELEVEWGNNWLVEIDPLEFPGAAPRSLSGF